MRFRRSVRGYSGIFTSRSQDCPIFVAVIGLHSSGSSCLAGTLHRLGVYFGSDLGGYWGADPQQLCGFESRRLMEICERAFPFPGITRRLNNDQISNELAKWVCRQRAEAAPRQCVAGGKYPQLCMFGEILQAICGEGLRVIHIDRPIEQSVASLVRREGHRHGHAALRRHQEMLEQHKKRFLKSCRHMTIQHADLLHNPRPEIQRAADFCGLMIADTLIDHATCYVRADLRQAVK